MRNCKNIEGCLKLFWNVFTLLFIYSPLDVNAHCSAMHYVCLRLGFSGTFEDGLLVSGLLIEVTGI